MNNKDSRIPTEYAIRLLDQVVAAGCDKSQVLQMAGLEWERISQTKDMSGKNYGLLYQAAMRASADEWFGMFTGDKVPLGSFRLMCLTLMSCANLRQVINRAGEFSEICRGMKVRFRVEENENEAIISMARVHSTTDSEYNRLIAEADPSKILTSIITWHKFAEWLTGKTLPLKTIQLTCPSNANLKPLAFIEYDCIKYQSDLNGFSFAPEYLDRPVVQDYDSLSNFLRSAPYHLVTQDPLQLCFAERVRNILKRDVSSAMPSAEQLASQLNMSVTTLRRQLAKDNASYQKLKDDCRMEAAIYYLSCLDMSNSDIAERLGFDEPSAFFRSFKKWTGQTPGEYRARSHAESVVGNT